MVAGLLTTGVAVAGWPDSATVTADPPAKVAASTPASARPDTIERTSRLLANGRPALSNLAGPAVKGKSDPGKASEKAADRAVTEKKNAEKQRAEKAAAKKEAAAKRKAVAKDKAAARRAATITPTRSELRVSGHKYTRTGLNVRDQPTSSGHLVTVLSAGSRLTVTKTTHGAWTLVIHRGKGRWVHTEYLSASKPNPKPNPKAKRKPTSQRSSSSSSSSSNSGSSAGLSSARCASGSAVESGLQSNAIKVHRAVCARYPSVKSYGGRRSGGDSFHTSGRAVDIMIPNASTGRKIADWVRANRKSLGVSEVIYAQHIWTVQRSGEGWRSMSDRGNKTANHYDHVHVSVY